MLLKFIRLINTTKDKKEQSLSYLDGLIKMWKKNASSSAKLATWESRSSLQMNTSCLMNGLKKENSIHGGLITNQFLISYLVDLEQEMSLEV